MKISNIDSFIEEFRNGRGIFSRTSIELAVREIVRLRKENNKLKVRLAASENDLVLIEVNEMLKKTQARVQELDKQTEAAGDLLESISMWLWKIQGLQPEPMWVDQFKSVCNLFEPPQQPESEGE
jgi:hypothetical protein